MIHICARSYRTAFKLLKYQIFLSKKICNFHSSAFLSKASTTIAIVVYFYLRSGKYPATYPKAHPYATGNLALEQLLKQLHSEIALRHTPHLSQKLVGQYRDIGLIQTTIALPSITSRRSSKWATISLARSLSRFSVPTIASSCTHLVLSFSFRSTSSPSVASSNSGSTAGRCDPSKRQLSDSPSPDLEQ